MNKVASYLQEHISGEVLTSQKVREYFSTDASILQLMPSIIVYPKNINDVRKVTRFAWQLAEKGHVIPITARGKGTDQAGAALGSGIILAFPAHMNKLLEMDTKQKLVRIQPGLSFRAFQDTMQTHGLFLPPYPSSVDYSTLGGAIANNTAGEKSVKYGSMRKFVDSLEVVLANGELIQTRRLSKRELNQKKGLTTFEGEIYRALDGLLTDNAELIQKHGVLHGITKNSAGYDLADIKRKDGSFDLTPLFVGSQGTLGVVTEAILRLEPFAPQTSLAVLFFDSVAEAGRCMPEILSLQPSAVEMVDRHLLEFVERTTPNRLKDVIEGEPPEVILLVEFDDAKDRARHNKCKKLEKFLKNTMQRIVVSDDFEEQQRLWAIRHAAATVTTYDNGSQQALPIIEDGIVPVDRFSEYLQGVYELLQKYELDIAVWGHAGDANLHMQPLMDLSKVGDRQKIFKLMSDYYRLVLEMGGSTSAEHNDGRLRAPYLKATFGPEMYEVFCQVKEIFDPHGILNPGVKVNVELKDVVAMLRQSYSIEHLADHLPRT